MKTQVLTFFLLCYDCAFASKTAAGANNDPLILYAVALLILGGLIGFPYLLKYIKNHLTNDNKSKDTHRTDSCPHESEQ